MNVAFPYTGASVLLSFCLCLGCGSANHLQEHDFAGRTAAVIAAIPPRPQVITGGLFDARVDLRDPVGTFFRAGTAFAKQAEARQAQERLDSALAQIDVAEQIARTALLQSAHLLAYRPVDHPDLADYVLDIRVQDYGLTASSFEASVDLEIEAEVLLIDNRTQEVIWKREIRETEPVSQAALGLGTTFGNIFTTAALSRLSVEEMADAFRHLADYTAERLVGRLARDYRRR